MKEYLEILQEIVDDGVGKENRTGTDTSSITGAMFKHDMSKGFPLLTTKKMAKKAIMTELQGFIRGETSKQWYKDRGCNIWNNWCNPTIVPYGKDDETKKKMEAEDDLGPIYGYQWRNFGQPVVSDVSSTNADQFNYLIEQLKVNPNNRRLVVSAWNPLQQSEMALAPCHVLFHCLANNGFLDLLWYQRSNDFPVGNPFNIASYGMLLHLIAKEVGLVPRKLIGMFGDVHIYENQMEGVTEQLTRKPYPLPTIKIHNWMGIYNWIPEDVEYIDYKHHPAIKYPIAV